MQHMQRSLGLALAVVLSACGAAKKAAAPASNTFRVAFIADTHLIDSYYVGPENTPLDSSSIFQSAVRLQKTSAIINAIKPAVEQVFVAGDIVHDFASADSSFYDHNYTVFDIAKDLFAGFNAPIHLAMGNHDYDISRFPRSFTEELFETKLGLPAPYYKVDYKGWRFLMLNCFEGETWDPNNPKRDTSMGSFGHDQLVWLDQQLSQGMPAVLVFHIPLASIQAHEFPDIDIFSVIQKHQDTIKEIIAGHWHIWVDAGTGYGAPHLVIAATRYDENNFAIADLTTDTHELHFVHPELWHMTQYVADPWPQ